MRINWLLIAALLQLPPSEKLSPEDSRDFHAEIRRLERLLVTAGDKSAIEYALARTWASGGQYREATAALEKVTELNAGLDPSPDKIFTKLHGTREYEAIIRRIKDQSPPIVRSRSAFTLGEKGLAPEGIAYDPQQKRFFFGGTLKPVITGCDLAGKCTPLVNDPALGEVLGLKVDPTSRTLWAAGHNDAGTTLLHFDVTSGALLGKYSLAGNHLFNDLVLNAQGDVFVTDTRGETAYWLSRRANRLEALHPALRINAANGIAISPDDKKLFVAGFPDGITVIDLPTRQFRAIAHPPDLCLATIDGLTFYKDSLIAIQNGAMVPRVVRLYLAKDLTGIGHFEILERRNPLFDGITTGAIAGDVFYFMANALSPNPTRILGIDLTR